MELESQKRQKPNDRLKSPPNKLLIHWRGEDAAGYSEPFRHPEFIQALAAVTNLNFDQSSPIHFENALDYDGEAAMGPAQLKAFNQAMQWLTISETSRHDVTLEQIIATAERCSLIHQVFEVTAVGTEYSELNDIAVKNGAFKDVMRGGENEKDTWAVRVRHFGDEAGGTTDKATRTGEEKTRSIHLEKKACLALKPMLLEFGGRVNLNNPDCKIYVFDGLKGKSALTRRIASGHKIFSMNPNTRICVTTTPLEPIAAFSLCNIAGIGENQRILDPFSGSCAILLAAAMISPSCQTVGIDIAHSGFINRDHITEDFATRGLTQPKAILKGDFTNSTIRDTARAAVGNAAFDHIVTDPPYGIREKMDANAPSPLEDLFQVIEDDRKRGVPLLKKGGKLVCFIPCRPEIDLADMLPSPEQADAAGLKFLLSREQPLNSQLSRWLVSYVCLK